MVLTQRQKRIGIAIPIFLIAGIVSLTYANNFFVHLNMESGIYWTQDSERVDLAFNASLREANITTYSPWLTTSSFNVTGGNATILIVDYRGSVILNYTDVSGPNIPAVNTTEILEDPPPVGYTLVVRTTGENVRVTFDYTEHYQVIWDGVPTAQIESAYYILFTLGILFIFIGVGMLFLLRDVLSEYARR